MSIKNHKRTINKNNSYYMYGIHTVTAALQNPKRKVHKIYATSKHLSLIQQLNKNIPVHIANNDEIAKIIGTETTHQGIIALVDSIFQDGLHIAKKPEETLIVILDQISDPHNIGAIIRSAAAFGIKTIILPKDNCPEENASIGKTASGCLEFVDVHKVTNISSTIADLKNHGFWILGLDGEAKQNINSVKGFDKIAVIIGAEGKGMRKLTKDNCDILAKIPMSNSVESLNASNAASICFYELTSIR